MRYSSAGLRFCADCNDPLPPQGRGFLRKRCVVCAPPRYHKVNYCQAYSHRHGGPCGLAIDPYATVCIYHGGGFPNVAQAVERRKEQTRVLKLAEAYDFEPVTDPWTAATEFGGFLLGMLNLLTERIGRLDEADLGTPPVAAWERMIDRFQRYLTDTAKLDIDAKRVQISTMQAQRVMEAWKDMTQELFDRLREGEPLELLERDAGNMAARHILGTQ